MEAQLKQWIREHLQEIKGQELRPGETLARRLALIGKSNAEEHKWQLIQQFVEIGLSGEFLEIAYWRSLIDFVIQEFEFSYFQIEENWKERAIRECGTCEGYCCTVEMVFFDVLEKAETSYWNPDADSELCELRRDIKRELNAVRKELLDSISPDEWIWDIPVDTRIEITERMRELQIQIAEVEGYFAGKLDMPDADKSVLIKLLAEFRKGRVEDEERFAEQMRAIKGVQEQAERNHAETLKAVKGLVDKDKRDRDFVAACVEFQDEIGDAAPRGNIAKANAEDWLPDARKRFDLGNTKTVARWLDRFSEWVYVFGGPKTLEEYRAKRKTMKARK